VRALEDFWLTITPPLFFVSVDFNGVSVSVSHFFSVLTRRFTSVDSKSFNCHERGINFRTELNLKTGDGLLLKQHFIIVAKPVKDN
jgi:hypothetical protein